MSTQTLERRPDAGTDFAELQTRMVVVAAAARAGCDGRSVVVVPSRTIDKWHEPAAETQAYEERLLCSLLELRDPALRMTYVTSSPVAPEIVDYYLALLPRRLRAGARSRLTLIAAGDRSRRPLSRKLLDRPRLLERIRRTIPAPDLCHLVPYNTIELERDLAVALGIPMYGADPRHAGLGTKSGCRALFAEGRGSASARRRGHHRRRPSGGRDHPPAGGRSQPRRARDQAQRRCLGGGQRDDRRPLPAGAGGAVRGAADRRARRRDRARGGRGERGGLPR
ncbi:MAG: hypothetical protein ACR2KV_08550 [Solirubrobacteraceae bacterium]